ncbi:MAG: hypothetical protein ACI819_002225, partial [Neolewinella sp.]
SVRTQKIRTEPLSFLIFSEPHPRHLSSSVDNNIKKKISLLKKKPVKPIL